MKRMFTLGAIALLVLAGAPALAEHHEESGGKASEHRSEKAAERSNAQWSEDATKGQERAERRAVDAPEREAKKAKAGQKGGVNDVQRTEKREKREAGVD